MTHEFKFILPEEEFASEILALLKARDRIGAFSVLRREQEQIRDVYYDEVDAATMTLTLAARSVACRLRRRQSLRVIEVKSRIIREQEYPHYDTREFWAPSGETPNEPGEDVLAHLRETLGVSRLGLQRMCCLRNDRETLVLARHSGGPTLSLHLDAFRVEDDFGIRLGELHEIELVSESASLVAEASELLTSSFRLVKIRRSKLENFAAAVSQRYGQQSLWLDTDTGVDDALALLLALRSPDLCQVLGVSAVSGNVPARQASANNARILHYASASAIPLCIGPGEIARGEPHTAQNVHGTDGMGDIRRHLGTFRPREPMPLLEIFPGIIQQQAPHSVVLVTTGPLTNVATLVRECPEALCRLRRMVHMGGAFAEAGNRHPSVEFNIAADPQSAIDVLRFCRERHLPHAFVPLDVTHRVVLEQRPLVARAQQGDARAEFLVDLTRPYMDFYHRNQALNGCPIHDAMAVGFVLWPELFVSDTYHVEIAGPGAGDFAGTTVADFRPTRLYRQAAREITEIALRVDRLELRKRLLERLLGAGA
ncbi:MAG TPA: nucleoside hydrolase [Verrucomicrobiota bacterium]|nr:nucleoside hydrolase [Verrucomicrobiota bacterium]